MIIKDGVCIYSYEHLLKGAKPCPFCGGTMITADNSEFFDALQKPSIVYVECKKCNVRVHGDLFDNYASALLSAVTHWNMRKEQEHE